MSSRSVYLEEQRQEEWARRRNLTFAVIVVCALAGGALYTAYWLGGEVERTQVRLEAERKAEAPVKGFDCRESMRLCIQQLTPKKHGGKG